MDHDTLIALRGELLSKLRKVTDVVERAQAEGRDLSRRERAELERLRNEAEEIRRRLPAPVDGRMTQHNGVPEAAREEPDALKPEERMSDWLRERGHLRSRGGFDEPERLSFGKMVRGAVTGRWDGAEHEQRALSGSVLADGGYALAPELAVTVIDRVRNAMQVMAAGATTVPLLAQTTYMARLSSGTSPVAWHAEGAAVADSQMGFERVVFEAKTLPVIVRISAELFEDLSPEATATIENEIGLALSLELDRACLRGSGVTPEPQGVLNQAGVTITSLGANGGQMAGWDTITDAVSVVRANNIEPSAILLASRSQQSLDKMKDSTGRYLAPPPSIAPVPRLTTNQIPTNLTVGSSSDCSEIYVGRWSDLLVGIRTDMRFNVRVLDQRFVDNLQYGLLCYLRADVQLAHPAAFNVVTGVRP